MTGLKRAILPPPSPPCQIPRRTVFSGFTNCSTRVFDQNAVKSALGRHRPHFCVILRCYTYTRSNASNLTHTASRVGAAAFPKHVRGGPRVTVKVMFTPIKVSREEALRLPAGLHRSGLGDCSALNRRLRWTPSSARTHQGGPGAATDPPDRAWMIVTGWGVNNHSHLSKLICWQHFN